MTARPAITPPDSRVSLGLVKPLCFASTPFGAGGLDGPSGPRRIGIYVIAGIHPITRRHSAQLMQRRQVVHTRSRRLYILHCSATPGSAQLPIQSEIVMSWIASPYVGKCVANVTN